MYLKFIISDKPDICSPYFKQLMQEEAAETKKKENETKEISCEDKTPTRNQNSETETETDSICYESQAAKTSNSYDLQKKNKVNVCESSVEKNNMCACVDNVDKTELNKTTDDKKSETSEKKTEEKIGMGLSNVVS